MSRYNKEFIKRANEIELTRRVLKQLLYALHVSEGFGSYRLLRVLYEWAETQDMVKKSSNLSEQNDEMLMIDKVLDNVLPSRFVQDVIGSEPLRDTKGREIKL